MCIRDRYKETQKHIKMRRKSSDELKIHNPIQMITSRMENDWNSTGIHLLMLCFLINFYLFLCTIVISYVLPNKIPEGSKLVIYFERICATVGIMWITKCTIGLAVVFLQSRKIANSSWNHKFIKFREKVIRLKSLILSSLIQITISLSIGLSYNVVDIEFLYLYISVLVIEFLIVESLLAIGSGFSPIRNLARLNGFNT
eukprot:TRINITY_DN5160_c0_g1_i2.p1 TRINITY_DN5160_c0_g1~~TRINITY_DN5160_c0_g1_i2.p1  ORF type:complete len:219 (+),score=15.65 TRINITY_DN5160_c0_g1_i2:60-659(+)